MENNNHEDDFFLVLIKKEGHSITAKFDNAFDIEDVCAFLSSIGVFSEEELDTVVEATLMGPTPHLSISFDEEENDGTV